MKTIGIEMGETKEGTAGATRRMCRLEVTADAVTIGDRRIAAAPDLLVLWHQGSAGTFHGVCDPVKLRAPMSKDARRPNAELVSAAGVLVGGEGGPRGVLTWSSSGGADIAALVVKVDREIAVVRSGYHGRSGWTVLLARPDGQGGVETERLSLLDYRARFAPMEVL